MKRKRWASSELHPSLYMKLINANSDSLRDILCSIQLIFDVIVLSEVWAANLEFYSNNLTGYNFFYELPHMGIVGGEGVYVRSIISQGMDLEVVEVIRHHMFGMTSNLFFHFHPVSSLSSYLLSLSHRWVV